MTDGGWGEAEIGSDITWSEGLTCLAILAFIVAMVALAV